MEPDHICVVGMAGRFPGAASTAELWQALRDGTVSITRFSDDELEAAGVAPAQRRDPAYVPARGVLADADAFDATFFGYSPREAEILDPQQRVLLECAWEALEDAGCNPAARGGQTGVFVGGMLSTYLLSNLSTRPDLVDTFGPEAIFHGNVCDSLATRVAYKLNLRGPALTVQTACSTSLVAVHVAAQSLLNGECDVALAGGVSIRVPQVSGYLHRDGGIESADGDCRPFDAGATGTVFGNGVGVVVLKRMSDALAAGHRIRAVLLGSAVNNDGDGKVGFTAPSVAGQVAVMEEALAVADVDPASVRYLQTHGTGTEIGDRVEAESIRQVYGAGRPSGAPLVLGAAKANLGHLDVAAGVAGLIVAVLALEHEAIPPHPRFTTPNAALPADGSVVVPTALLPWQAGGAPRRAAVSALGVGGTNVHVVIEEPPRHPGAARADTPVRTLTLSAKSRPALEAMTDRLAGVLRDGGVELADVARTLQDGRQAFSHRRAVCGTDAGELAAQLERRTRRVHTRQQRADAEVAFAFSGQGGAAEIVAGTRYHHDPVFRAAIDEAAAVLAPHVSFDLLDFVARGRELRHADTAVLQPVLLAYEVALARSLQARGVRPARVLGHSLGEYAAACVAGVWTFDDALRLVATRGRLMAGLPPGAMLTVVLPEDELRRVLPGDLDLAAVNGPALCVVSGPPDAVERFRSRLADERVATVPLPVERAFHSRATEAIAAPFAAALGEVAFHVPTLPVVSGVTGEWLGDHEATSAEYWLRHLREPVRFHASLRRVASPATLVVEVGPGTVLRGFARPGRAGGPGDAPPPDMVSTESEQAYEEAVAAAWTLGVPVTWSAAPAGRDGRVVSLPPYPFERTRHWVAPAQAGPPTETRAAPARESVEPEIGVARVSWEQVPGEVDPDILRGERLNWLVFDDAAGSARGVVDALTSRGQVVTVVRPGSGFRRAGRGVYEIDPSSPEQYAELLRTLRGLVRTPTRIVHCWGASPAGGEGADPDASFFDLVLLARAMVAEGLLHRVVVGIVTAGVFDVTGAEELHPGRALAVGVALTLPQELDNVAATLIDLPSGLAPDDGAVALRIVGEVQSPAEPIVALRGRHRWRRVLRDEAAPPRPAPAGSRTFVITGGRGGIGMAAAARFVREGHRVALVSRGVSSNGAEEESSLPAGAEDRVLELRADVTDAAALAAALDRVRAAWGAIDVVVHAAGVAGGGSVIRRDPQAMRAVLAPKVAGTRNLLRALEGDPGVTVLLCSSAASVLGAYGQADYAAANAFMDAAAVAERARGRRVLAVSWQTWREVGMAASASVPASVAALHQAALARGIPTEAGLDAMWALLQRPAGHYAVIPRRNGELQEPVWVAEAHPAGDTARQPRPELSSPYEEPRDDVQRRLVAIWEDYLGVAPIGVHDDFIELGGHSLLAAQIVARLRREFEVAIPVTQMFTQGCIADIALEVERLILDEVEAQR